MTKLGGICIIGAFATLDALYRLLLRGRVREAIDSPQWVRVPVRTLAGPPADSGVEVRPGNVAIEDIILREL